MQILDEGLPGWVEKGYPIASNATPSPAGRS
jgi:3-mercaptopyruvate sulfurtransferase SseA